MSDVADMDNVTGSLSAGIEDLAEQLRQTQLDGRLMRVDPQTDDPAIRLLAAQINNVLGNARSSVVRLEDANRDLDMLIQQRTAELEHARITAELNSTAKSKFLAEMSHELRTPLNSIIGFSQLLLDSKKEVLSERQGKQVRHILRGGRHLLGLINNVLDLSKIENGNLDLNIEAVDMEVVITESLQMISPLIGTGGVTFENRIDPGFDMPGALGDFLRIKQCLINLLSNACKYNKPDGKVWIDARVFKDQWLRITVGDSGLGIPENKHHELFRPFSRLGREETDIEGSGVGLVLTRLLVHAMEGVLDFESREGEGSRFWFDLPITEKPAEADAQLEMTPVNLGKRPQGLVLYIEDIASNVLLMEDMLSEYTDVQVLTAPTAEEGIAMALDQLPDLIIMDLNLSGMNGIDATRYIRNVASIRNIPIFVLTGDVQETTQERCEKAGIDKFFAKPFKVNEFLGAVNEVLDQRLGKLL
ncbi:ATP-binding protein [Thalassospiraceae bacterium LMO-JJ14]|nr:ATP-binding protein [Thalassospiraceae bacterium LMO-JJ14]